MKSGDSDRLEQLVDQGIDCYAILGLPSGTPNLTSTIIKQRFNDLMKEERDELKIRAYNDALSILQDSSLRAKHDNALGHDKLNAALTVPTNYAGIGTQNQTRTGVAADSKSAKDEHLAKKAGIHAKMAISGKYTQFSFVKHAEEVAKTSSRAEQLVAPQPPQISGKHSAKMEAEAARARKVKAAKEAAAREKAATRAISTGSIPSKTVEQLQETRAKSVGDVPSQKAIDYVSLIKQDRDEHRQQMAEIAEKSPLRTWFRGRDKDGLTKNEQAALKILQTNGNTQNVKDVLASVRNKKSSRSI